MTTILDLIGGVLATSVLVAAGAVHGDVIVDTARDVADARIAGEKIQQAALMIGREVEKANMLMVDDGHVTSLTCATEKCTS